MKKPRVLMTVDAVGGVWQYALDLAKALEPLGADVELALLGPVPNHARQAELAATGLPLIETGLPLDWLSSTAREVEQASLAVARLAHARKADLVHLNQPSLAVGTSFAAPVVAVVHSCLATWWAAVEGASMPPPSFQWQIDLVAQALTRADAIVCPTRAHAAAVRRAYDLPSLPHVVHNGRSADYGTAAVRGRHALYVGRLWDRGKNLTALDRIAGGMRYPVKAAGALRGPHGETAAAALNLQRLGSLDATALAGCLAERPAFVSTALYEPFGLSVLEAARAGCPLVLSDIPTFRELWGGAAQLNDPEDPGVPRLVDSLLEDDALHAAWGARAKHRAATYTIDRTAVAIAAIYRRCGIELPAQRSAA